VTPPEPEKGKMACAAQVIISNLTVDNFDSVFEVLMGCGFDHPDHISSLLREIFEVAAERHQSLAVYAELCVRLSQHPKITGMAYSSSTQKSFRGFLQNHCNMVIQELLEPCKLQKAFDEEASYKWKQQALGSVKFIAHLLVIGMLTSKMLVECAEELLSHHERCPEVVEPLTALLMVAGPKFDHVDWPYHSKLDALLCKMQKIVCDKNIPSRVRFLLRDVLDVRSAGWATNKSLVPGQRVLMQVDRDSAHAPPDAKRQQEHSQNEAPSSPMRAQQNSSVCQSVEATPPEPRQAEFDVVVFRRALAGLLADLPANRDVRAAVDSVRSYNVPPSVQPNQYVDILTRVVEERRGPCRRCGLAFAVGIAADGAFDRIKCLDGLGLFFEDVYAELCSELPRLPAIVAKELLPSFQAVFHKPELNGILPTSLRS
jgi:hypothetical protein